MRVGEEGFAPFPAGEPAREVPFPAGKPARVNPARGEVMVAGYRLRPSFAALAAAEGELGPLFALVERAAAGALNLSELVTLFWHCCDPRPAGLTRAAFSEALLSEGLAALTPPLRVLLGQILRGG